MSERRQVNFTIVPAESGSEARTYANFCAVSHTPFDFTLTFCEVQPLTQRDLQAAESNHVVQAPVKAKLVVPVQFIPNLISALQEQWRVFGESQPSPAEWTGGPVH